MIEEFKCPNCNGTISFDSLSQKMKCPYCDSEFEPDALKEYDEVVKGDREDDMQWEEPQRAWTEEEKSGIRRYVCASCGGEIIGDETLGATTCPYCDNNTIIVEQFKGDLKPDLVIPFKYDKKAAKSAMLAHFKGKRLLPKAFKDEQHIDEIKGIYVPFWLYGACAEGNFRYRCTRVRSWPSGNYIYTETSYFSVLRGGTLNFENVPVDGSQKMPDDLMESLEPYDLNEAVDFNTAYLAGFFADRYDVSSQESSKRANARVRTATEEAFSSTVVGYASVLPEHSDVSLSRSSAKYALLPVWILNTTWKNEKYVFAMNGQTGKLVGNLPVDKKLYFKWLFGIAASVTSVLFLLLLLLCSI